MKRVPTMFRYGGWLLMMVYQLFGMRVLLLTTTGRKSGLPRTNPTMYVKQNGDFFIAAIPPRTQRFPNWYHNLKANPEVTVELFWKRSPYHAEILEDASQRVALLKRFPFGLVEAVQDHAAEDIPVIQLKKVQG